MKSESTFIYNGRKNINYSKINLRSYTQDSYSKTSILQKRLNKNIKPHDILRDRES